jgi:deoxyribose-phosphate aldolase
MHTTNRERTAPPGGPLVTATRPASGRNVGIPLELDWIREVRINRSAVERRTATIPRRRTVKKDWQVAWLLRAVTLIDLTTLSGDDTPGRVRRLCAKARQPVRSDVLNGLGAGGLDIRVGAVCVYHAMVETAVEALRGSGIPVAAVSTGFPAGLSPLPQRLQEIRASLADGAKEIDIVITRAHVLTGQWDRLYDEVRAFREACGDAHMKTILATGELGTLRNVAKASLVCMMAGADFIKTSTGKEPVNATLPVGLVMSRMIRTYRERTGHRVGFKPAGGIRAAKEALDWMLMMKDELGPEWLTPGWFRFGASTLLTDIERQLEFHLTGRYAAAYRQPMA